MKKLQQMPTFQQIRQQAKTIEGRPITRQDIVALTGLSLGEVYVVDIGGFSPKRNVQSVLVAFNFLTGHRLTAKDIRYRDAMP